jgi:protein-S-isoprenylcysteine O-methyltransferase Ste14
MMTEKMTKWGVGPKIMVSSICYTVLIVAISIVIKASFSIEFILYQLLVAVAILLFLLGVPFYIISVLTLLRAYNDGKLFTSGVFGVCRNPIYSSWIFFLVPGVALLFNSWLGLTVPLAMYVFFRVYIGKEEVYLEKTFGKDYMEYKQNVPRVFPVGWIKCKCRLRHLTEKA